MRTSKLSILVSVACAVGCAAEVEPERSALSHACSGFNHDYQIPGPVGWAFEPHDLAAHAMDRFAQGFVTVHPRVAPPGAPGSHAMLMLTDLAGASPAVRRFGTPALAERFDSVVVSHDSEHVIATGAAQGDLWVAKIRLSNLQVVWSVRVGDAAQLEIGTAIRRVSDAIGMTDYLALGTAGDTVAGLDRLYLVRIGDDGTLRWSHRYVEAGVRFEGTTMDSRFITGRVLVAGIRHDTGLGGGRDLALVQIRQSDGAFLQMDYYPHEIGLAAAPTPSVTWADDGGWAVAYSSREATGSYAVFLRLDSTFDPLFENLYSNLDAAAPDVTFGRSIVRRSDGGFDIGTETDDRSALLTIDAAGNVIGHRHYGDLVFDELATSPMQRLSTTSVLKAMRGDIVSLTSVPTPGSGCCERDIDTSVTPTVPIHLQSDMPEERWGAIQPYPVSVESVPVTTTSCP